MYGSAPYGVAPYGGLETGVASGVPASATTTVPTVDLKISIGGVDRSGILLIQSLQINDELGQRNSASMGLVDFSISLHPSPGQSVSITRDASTIFAGTIEDVEESVPLGGNVLFIALRCVDYNQLFDRHIVTAKYSSLFQAAKTLGYIVKDIVNNTSGDVGEALKDEGITTGGVQDGPVIASVTFRNKTAAECMDDLAKLTGYSWNVGYDKNLAFFDRSTYLAPVDLDPAKWDKWRDLKIQKSRTDYRNVQYIEGGTDFTDVRVETFTGDGTNRTFNLSYPVAFTTDYPAPVIEITGPTTVGVDRIIPYIQEQKKDARWFYKVGDRQIVQNGQINKLQVVPLTSADTLKVTYRGKFPNLMVGRSDFEVESRKSVEGGTGVYANVESDDKIDGRQIGEERVEGLLRRFGRIPVVIGFETDFQPFASGQIMNVNLSDHAISNQQFLITRVNIRLVGTNVLRYHMEMIDGEQGESWVEFFKKRNAPFIENENEKINILKTRSDVLNATDTMGTGTSLQTWTTDPYGAYVMGKSSVGTRKFDNSLVGPLFGVPANMT